MLLSPDTSTALEVAVGVAHVEFNASMAAHTYWMFVSTTNCWIKQGSHAALTASGASAGAGSMFVPALAQVVISGDLGADLSVIEDTATGKASLTRMMHY